MTKLATQSEQITANKTQSNSFGKMMRNEDAKSKPVKSDSNFTKEKKAVKNNTNDKNAIRRTKDTFTKEKTLGAHTEDETKQITNEENAVKEKNEPGTSTKDKNGNMDKEQAKIDAVAQALNVSDEVVAEILAKLHLTVQALSEPENMNLFVRELFGAETKAELLNIPDIQSTFKNLRNALAQFDDATSQTNIESSAIADGAVPTAETAEQKMFTQNFTKEEGSEEKTQSFTKENPNEIARNKQKPFEPIRVEVKADVFMNPSPAVNSTQPLSHNQTVKFEAVRNLDTQDVLFQMTEKLKVELKGDTTEVKMLLKPESLGEVALKISTQNGIVTAQFVAESQRVKEVIEAGFNQLKDMLTQQGINVAQLQVSVGGERQNEAANLYDREKSAKRVMQILEVTADFAEDAAINPYDRDLSETSIDYMA